MARTRRAFTLVELLVVMAIISILAGLLLPVLQKARGAALFSSCTSNLRQVFLFMTEYADSWGGMIPHNGGTAAETSYYYKYSTTRFYQKAINHFGQNIDQESCILKCPQTGSSIGGRLAGRPSTQYDYAQNIYLGGWDQTWTPKRPPKQKELSSFAYVIATGGKRGPHSWYLTNMGIRVWDTWSYSEGLPNLDGNPWPWNSAPSFPTPAVQGHPDQKGNFLFGDGHTNGFSHQGVSAMGTQDRYRLNGVGVLPSGTQ